MNWRVATDQSDRDRRPPTELERLQAAVAALEERIDRLERRLPPRRRRRKIRASGKRA